ncbi:hypothetical protein ACWG0P_01350 [Amedibacillus sp. YH-ame6]
MKKKFLLVFILSCFFSLLSCSTACDTPQDKISAYINAMIEGNPQKAANIVNVDLENQDNKVEKLELELMKFTFSKAKFKILKVEESERKMDILIQIENVSFLNTLDKVKKESIAKSLTDDETIALFKKNSEKASTIKQQVMISFIKEKEEWIFFGSTDVINSALLGLSIK